MSDHRHIVFCRRRWLTDWRLVMMMWLLLLCWQMMHDVYVLFDLSYVLLKFDKKTIHRSAKVFPICLFCALICIFVFWSIFMSRVLYSPIPNRFSLSHGLFPCIFQSVLHLLCCELHWLDVPRWIQYKLRVTVHRCVQGRDRQCLGRALQTHMEHCRSSAAVFYH